MSAFKHDKKRCMKLQVSALLLIGFVSLGSSTQAQQRDPTRPPTQQDVSGRALNNAALALQSVHVGETDRWAMINGTKLREGEQMGRYRVTSIALSEVHLEADGKRVIVRMYESIKSTTATQSTDQGGQP